MALGSDRRDGKGEAGRPRHEAALTIIATGTRVVGDVESDSVVKVEGKVVGSVRAGRQVLVARGGEVEGDVATAEAVVGGEVRGSVTAKDRVEVQSGAVVHGDLVTERLVVQEGGEVNGLVKMGNDAALSRRPAGSPAPAQAVGGTRA